MVNGFLARTRSLVTWRKIRWFLAGMSLIALIGVFGGIRRQSQERERAVAKIENLGGSVERESSCPDWVRKLLGDRVVDGYNFFERIVGIDASGEELEDSQLEFLRYFPDLEHLNLDGTPITSAGLQHISRLINLKSLNLAGTLVTDRKIGQLKKLSNLESLDLGGTEISDEGLVGLKDLANLRYLSLAATQISDLGLVHLKGLTRLEELNVEDTKLDGSGFAHLADLAKLETLYLDSSLVDDSGLRGIGQLGHVKSLRLLYTRITDAGLVHLKGMFGLENLELGRTSVTGSGFVHLGSLPRLEGVQLFGTPVDDAGLVHLGRLDTVRLLDLEETQVTGAGLASLKGMTNLMGLNLSQCSLDDTSLTHLSRLPNLQWIDLSYTRVSDEGLMQLKGSKSLQWLSLEKTLVTAKGFEALRETLPALTVDKTATGQLPSNLVHVVADEEDPPDYGEIHASLHRQIDLIFNPKPSFNEVLAYNQLFENADRADLLALKRHHLPRIAIRAAWENVRRTIPEKNQRSAFVFDARLLQRFLGFVEGRLRVALPRWWENGFFDAQAYSQRNIHFAGEKNVFYYAATPNLVAPRGTLIREQEGDAILSVGEDSIPLPAFVIEKSANGVESCLSVCFTNDRCYLANHSYSSDVYPLTCIDRVTSKVLWKTDVRKKCLFHAGSGGRGSHVVAVRTEKDRILVFGMGNAMAYAEGFDAENGENLFRFSTDY